MATLVTVIYCLWILLTLVYTVCVTWLSNPIFILSLLPHRTSKSLHLVYCLWGQMDIIQYAFYSPSSWNKLTLFIIYGSTNYILKSLLYSWIWKVHRIGQIEIKLAINCVGFWLLLSLSSYAPLNKSPVFIFTYHKPLQCCIVKVLWFYVCIKWQTDGKCCIISIWRTNPYIRLYMYCIFYACVSTRSCWNVL